MVEVFKTNVEREEEAEKLLHLLHRQFPGSRINFDLHDCDKILRVEGAHTLPVKVMQLVQENGFACSVLD